MNFDIKKFSYEYLLLSLGAFLYTLGVQGIILPSGLSLGGIGGISLISHYLFNTPVGVIIILLNLPLYIWGYFTINREFVFKTIYVVILSAVLIDLSSGIRMTSMGDNFLSAIFGGLVIGLGGGICYAQGGSAGGTDIIAKALNKKYGVSLGSIGLVFNIFVISLVAIFINLNMALYTIISIFASSRIIDAIQTGLPTKISFIISDKSEEISSAIVAEIGRGVTVLKGEGAYTHSEKDVLMCAVHWVDLYRVKKLVSAVDSNAFIIISDASEILGKGFKKAVAK